MERGITPAEAAAFRELARAVANATQCAAAPETTSFDDPGTAGVERLQLTRSPARNVAPQASVSSLASPGGELVPLLLTTAEAAKLLAVANRTLWRWSRSGLAPSPVTVGGAVRFRRTELLEWIAAGCPRMEGGEKRHGERS